MTRLAALALAALAGIAALTAALPAAAAPPTYNGTVGPGFTIKLSQKPTKAGTIKLVVADKSSIHNFTVKGPGISNKTITGTGFMGTKTAVLTLRAGKYTLYCTVHPTSVTTTITVK